MCLSCSLFIPMCMLLVFGLFLQIAVSYHDFHPLSTEKLKRSRLRVKGEAVSEGSNTVTVFELEVRNLPPDNAFPSSFELDIFLCVYLIHLRLIIKPSSMCNHMFFVFSYILWNITSHIAYASLLWV